VHDSCILSCMELSQADAAVVRLVGQFKQLSSVHIQTACFADTSAMTLSRHLNRLVLQKYLARVGRRSTSVQGGSGAYVYQLAPRGWIFVQRDGRYWPYRAIDLHKLHCADIYIDLLNAERGGTLKIIRFGLERAVSPVVRADIALALGVIETNKRIDLYIEVDLGTERPKRIEAKLNGYWDTYRRTPKDSTFPAVIFVVPDTYRAKQIRTVIAKRYKDTGLFQVCQFKEVVSLCLSFFG
jgi:hypothetical protein